jgi:hypothetical protein
MKKRKKEKKVKRQCVGGGGLYVIPACGALARALLLPEERLAATYRVSAGTVLPFRILSLGSFQGRRGTSSPMTHPPTRLVTLSGAAPTSPAVRL